MREPLRWCLRYGRREDPERLEVAFRAAARGVADDARDLPPWLLPHQREAVRRIAGCLACFHGAFLADATGLGKTWVALAIAARYRSPLVVAPAALVPQWQRLAARLDIPIGIVSDQSLSLGGPMPQGDFLVVDEAHRFRNPATRRYDALARGVRRRDLLLVTATPVVNTAADLAALLRLFLPDNGLSVFGIGSIEQAVAESDYEGLAYGMAGMTVARPASVLAPGDSVPMINDGTVFSDLSLPPSEWSAVMQALRGLAFPGFATATPGRLLALHLRHRLASSSSAAIETLLRHRAYLDRAIAAAEQGTPLGRRDARMLFGPEDDPQLALDLGTPVGPALDRAAFLAARSGVQQIITLLRANDGESPKLDRLRQLIEARAPRKTIVFTAATATAFEIARKLRWNRVALVSGRGAWIASGKVTPDEALDLFAPGSREAPAPGGAAEVRTLVATDLVSEGLNLQDADGVIHYDVPWTPLRLEQRLGRIVRLGSAHRHVDVWWFVPPRELELDLRLARRIRDKARRQTRLGAPGSSIVGRARFSGLKFEWRQRFGSPGSWTGPAFGVVLGPPATVVAVRWLKGPASIPELIVLENGREVRDERTRACLVESLLAGRPVDADPPTEQRRSLRLCVRSRLVTMGRGPCDHETRRHARIATNLGVSASRARNGAMVAALDGVLDRIARGLVEGERRELESLIGGRPLASSLSRWLGSPQSAAVENRVGVVLDAALFGVNG